MSYFTCLYIEIGLQNGDTWKLIGIFYKKRNKVLNEEKYIFCCIEIYIEHLVWTHRKEAKRREEEEEKKSTNERNNKNK